MTILGKRFTYYYIDDEVKETVASILNKKKPSDFFNTLSKEEAKKMQISIANARNEWQRDI